MQDIVEKHWKTYGRNYYGRYDYEGVEADSANKMMAYLAQMAGKSPMRTRMLLYPHVCSRILTYADVCYGGADKWPSDAFGGYTLDKADSFEYLDPIDGSLSKNQALSL